MVYGKISIITSARTNGNPIKTHRFAPLLHKKSGGNAYVFQLFLFLFATKNVLQSKHNRIYKRSDRSSRSRRSYGANGTARRTRPCRSARSNGRHGCYGRNRSSGRNRSARSRRSSGAARRTRYECAARRTLCLRRDANRCFGGYHPSCKLNHDADHINVACLECDNTPHGDLSRHVRRNRHQNHRRQSLRSVVRKRLGNRKRNYIRKRVVDEFGKSVKDDSVQRDRRRHYAFALQRFGRKRKSHWGKYHRNENRLTGTNEILSHQKSAVTCAFCICDWIYPLFRSWRILLDFVKEVDEFCKFLLGSEFVYLEYH